MGLAMYNLKWNGFRKNIEKIKISSWVFMGVYFFFIQANYTSNTKDNRAAF